MRTASRLFALAGFLLLFRSEAVKGAAAPATENSIRLESLLQELSDPTRLTWPADYVAGMVSTWDRSGGNRDADNFLLVQGERVVLADLEGPGVITRLWSASPTGRVRIFLDGATEPMVDVTAKELFSGDIAPFLKPLVGSHPGGYSYVPIPFAHRCRIELVAESSGSSPGPAPARYWQVSFRRYPVGTAVQSLTLPLSPAVLSAWPSAESLGGPPEAGGACQPRKLTLLPRGRREVEAFRFEGSGYLYGFELKAAEDYYLRVFWDGEPSPSLELPVWFSRIPFAMPFGRQAVILLACDGPCAADTVSLELTVCPAAAVSENRLHGWYHQEWTRPHQGPNLSAEHNYPVLRVADRGLYVGTWLMVWNKYFIWWGEGDEMVFVDGEDWPPAFHGTGTEDYFDGAWTEFGRSPFAGTVLQNSLGKFYAGRTLAYRWHRADPIPFQRSLHFSFEHGQQTNDLDNLYASLAFWYQAEPHGSLPALPPAAARMWEEAQLSRLVEQEGRQAVRFKLVRGFRLAGLGLLALLALFPVILFGVRMLGRRNSSPRAGSAGPEGVTRFRGR